MALYTKKDFAKLCFRKPNDLSNNIKRAKVVVEDSGMIDSDHAVNAAFIKISQEKAKLNDAPDVVIHKVESTKTGSTKPKPVQQQEENDSEGMPDYITLTKQEKYRKVKKLDSEITLNDLKIEKQRGELIPTDLITNVTVMLAESIRIAHTDSVENEITVIAQNLGLSGVELADLRTRLTKVINTATDTAINVAKKSIKNIVLEYSDIKGVGERE